MGRASVSRAALLITLAAVLAGPPLAHAQPAPYGANDYGGFRDVLPPGTNGLITPAQLLAYEANPNDRPSHNDDQLQMYENLPFAEPITEAQIPLYYKDATFGVQPGDVATTESPEAGVTIERDKQFGVPHIYGDTRAELMFGIGYASAEDRLFFMDALRHIGRAELTAFAGGAASNQSFDAGQWQVAPYTEQDLQNQFNALTGLGPPGQQVRADIISYIAGINAYIAKAKLDPFMMPGEYEALGQPGGPQPFVPADVVSIASLIGAEFGNGGGGDQLNQAQLLLSFEQRFGVRRGLEYWADFAGTNDPEAPSTVAHKSFPYDLVPRHVARGSVAMPDRGSVVPWHTQVVSSALAPDGAARQQAPLATLALHLTDHQMSNALLISARDSASGHPLAVFGPQVGYFSPEILMEEDIHGPGIDAQGAAFPGTNMYVQLGHGEDYAWSATSADQDITDTFALALCNPSGGAVALSSTYYSFRGKCLPMQELQRINYWTPNASDQTPPGHETLTEWRTQLGLLVARARIHGRPVAYVQERSTYMNELSSVVGLERFNDPGYVHDARSWQRAASGIAYAFNWFYTDNKHIAFFNSGANPVRPTGIDPRLPTWSSFTWKGFNPSTNIARYTPSSQHAQVIDQPYMTSWNNKSAPGDGIEGTPIYRSLLLSDGIGADLHTKHRLTLADLINVMANAATVDLRGSLILPLALKVIGNAGDPAVRQAVSELRAWVAAGAHRHSAAPGQPYEDSDAIRIMDAWWPKLVSAMFEPAMGTSLYNAFKSEYGIDNVPNGGDGIGDDAVGTSPGEHVGSAWDGFFFGYVQKDLREVLRHRVRGRYHRVWCGGGVLTRCRAALVASLAPAAAEPLTQVYPADGTCSAGDQVCWDEISFSPAGAVSQPLMPWQNRPTFQQVVEVQRHR